MTNRWYVVQSKFHQEVRARIGMAEQGYDTFLPQYRKRIRHAGKVQDVVRPFFPGYLFVCFDRDTDPWERICDTRGVQALLGVETVRHPLPLPIGYVERLRGMAKAGMLDSPDVRGDRFLKDEIVRIEDGPFMGYQAMVEADEGGRVKILLDLLGRQTQTHVARKSLSRVGVG